MAEFENGYCTGCGAKPNRKWLKWMPRHGHRPFCWRYMCMKYNLEPTDSRVTELILLMRKHWRILSRFLCKQEHVYYYPSGKGLNVLG